MRNEMNTIIGSQNEARAVEFLEREGFQIIEQNYYARKLGELDIVAMYDDVLHFIHYVLNKLVHTVKLVHKKKIQ